MSLKENDNLDVSSESVLSRQECSTTDNTYASTENDTSSEEEGNPSRKSRRFGNDATHNALEKEEVVDECPAELKTLRYKIMLMNGNTPVEVAPPAKNSYANLQQFLEKEKNNNTKENWSKLNKSIKHKKITEFVDMYTASNELTEEERVRLLEVLKQNMIKGKLTKNKEVNYDKTKGVIKEMPCLVFNKTTRHFTIKNMDTQKHSTTIKKASFVKAVSGAGGGSLPNTVVETSSEPEPEA
jgi:hypothetical protein